MKVTILLTLWATLLSSGSALAQRGASRTADELSRSLDRISVDLDAVSDRARRMGIRPRASLFAAMAGDARQLEQQLSRNLMRSFRSGDSSRRFVADYDHWSSNFSQWVARVNTARQLPEDISYDLQDAVGQEQRLSRYVDSLRRSRPLPPPHRPQPPHHRPRPPRPPIGGEWVATCQVVLEMAWGSNLQKFIGTAQAYTEHEALAFATNDAMANCNAHRQGNLLTKCTVDRNNCAATFQRYRF